MSEHRPPPSWPIWLVLALLIAIVVVGTWLLAAS